MKKEVQKKEVGFITVINTIVGIIIAVFFILTLIRGLYLVGVLFLVLAVFIFLPQKILRFSKWLKLLIGGSWFLCAFNYCRTSGAFPRTRI